MEYLLETGYNGVWNNIDRHRQSVPLQKKCYILMGVNTLEKDTSSEQFQLHLVLLSSVVLAVVICFYTYLYAQNYDFFIEAPCSTAFEQCYVRDCSEGDCPPNNLSAYSVYSIPAGFFVSCSDNSCYNICEGGGAACKKIPCSSQSGAECLGPVSSQ